MNFQEAFELLSSKERAKVIRTLIEANPPPSPKLPVQGRYHFPNPVTLKELRHHDS